MLPASSILKNCGFSACSDMKSLEYIFQMENAWTSYPVPLTERISDKVH